MITDLTVKSRDRVVVDGIVNEKIIFEFTLPFIPSPITPNENYLSGFQLFRDSVIVKEILLKDVITTTGMVNLEYLFSDVPGQNLDFQVTYVDYDVEISDLSNTVTIESVPSAITYLDTKYHRDYVRVTWNQVTDPTFQKYILLRGIQEKQSTLIESIITSTGFITVNFTENITGLVRAVYLGNSWVKTIIDSDTCIFTNEEIEHYSNPEIRYEQIERSRFDIYYTNSFTEVCELPTTNIILTSDGIRYWYDDPTVISGRNVYAIRTDGVTVGNEFFEVFSDVYAENQEPRILHWSFQNDPFLNNPRWRVIKNVLVDKNVYDKSFYAIPYAQKGDEKIAAYILDGYVGVGGEVVEIYVNGHLRETITATSTGYFTFNFDPKLGPNKLRLTTATPNVERKSKVYDINTYNIYSTFATLGTIFQTEEEILEQVRKNFFLDTVDANNIEPNFATDIGLRYSAQTDKSLENFRRIVAAIRKAHLSFGIHESLKTILDVFLNDHYTKYEIFEHNSHLNTYAPYTVQIVSKPNLTRANYFYGVTALTNRGGETNPTIINLDKRWWMFFREDGIGLKWTSVPDAVNYKIYRGCDEDPSTLKYLITTTTGITEFVDIGIEGTDNQPPTFNFTVLDNVQNLVETRTAMNLDGWSKIKARTGVTVIVYTDAKDFSELTLNRLFQYLSLAVGVLKLTLVIASDTYIIVKQQDDMAIMYVEGTGIETVIQNVEVGGISLPWIAEDEYFYADIVHNLDSDDIIPRAKLNGTRVVPGFRRVSKNVLRIYWNTNSEILMVDILKVP